VLSPALETGKQVSWDPTTWDIRGKRDYLVAHELADIRGAGICDGNDLDKLSIVDGACPLGREGGSKVDTPVCAEPNQGLDCDDCAEPDKGPLWRVDVFFVELAAEIEAQEDGPYYREGPDVGVTLERQRPQQLGRLDLRVVDERRHGGSRRRAKLTDNENKDK